jgi:hypothetical protein
VLGTDGSGVIAAVGSGVRRFKIGGRVHAYAYENPKGGFYAEYVAVSAKMVAHIPKPLDLEHAGAIPTTGLTALQGIDHALHLKKGETFIIHGATGGVGNLAVQFGKQRGARVLATVSGEGGLDFARGLGADIAVDGMIAVAIAIALSAAATPLAFLGNGWTAYLGISVWGIGTTVQDSLLVALVAKVTSEDRRSTAYGVFDTIYGVAWLAGSVALAVLYDHYIWGLVALSVGAQIAAIPVFFIGSVVGGTGS